MHDVSYILYLVSCIMHYASCILYLVSCILSCILYLVSCILHPVSCILYPVSCIMYHVSCIMHIVQPISHHVSSRRGCSIWCCIVNYGWRQDTRCTRCTAHAQHVNTSCTKRCMNMTKRCIIMLTYDGTSCTSCIPYHVWGVGATGSKIHDTRYTM